MSAQRLSDVCADFGADIPRNTITNLENGRKESLPFHELVVIAAALMVDPVELLFPGAKETRSVSDEGEELPAPTVEYFPNDVIPARDAWDRFVGSHSPASVRVEQARAGAERVAQLLREVQGGSA